MFLSQILKSFLDRLQKQADESISLIPDFIANCGMARVFAYLMSHDLKKLNDHEIFEDTSQTIYNALKETHKVKPENTGLAKAAFEIALNQLV